MTTTGNIVQIHQHGDGPLPPIGSKAGPVGIVHVEGIKVREVLLRVEVSSHLWEFHVAAGLASQS